MKKFIAILLFIAGSSLANAQTILTVTGQTFTHPTSDYWDGYNPARSTVTTFTFSNNSVTSANETGFMLQAGDDYVNEYNGNLNGEVITGNYFNWTGSAMATSTHGLFVGHNINATVRYNYIYHPFYGTLQKSATNQANTSGGIAYNIINCGATGINIKGMSGTRIYNNTIYQTRTTSQTWRGLIDIYVNSDYSYHSPATGTKIKNNIFYAVYETPMIYIEDPYASECLTNFESDYNIFYCQTGTVYFKVGSNTYTFAQWQALGYDTHSVVMNPNFINMTAFVPTTRLDYGTDLGTTYDDGLSTTAVWSVGYTPATTPQNGTWQCGARVYPAAESGVYYVSTTGSDSGAGTIGDPWLTWNYGFNHIGPGDILYIRGGTYSPSAYQTITYAGQTRHCGVLVNSKDGTSGGIYHVYAYQEEIPVLNCVNINDAYYHHGILLYGSDYWYLKGLTVSYATQYSASYGGAGITNYGGQHVTFELCNAHHNGGPGFLTQVNCNETLLKNCDSYYNWDSYTSGGDADGFDIGYALSDAIIRVTGCRSWENSDDGYDMFQGSGYSGIYYLTNCWAWRSGYQPGTETTQGDGCGFKYGNDAQNSYGITRRYSYNCIAYDNLTRGFSQESALVKKEWYNCIAYANNTYGFSFAVYTAPPDILYNNISYANSGGNMELLDDRTSVTNSWDSGMPTIADGSFMSLTATQLVGARQANGDLPVMEFLHPSTGSNILGVGTTTAQAYDGDGELWGNPRAIGAFEYITGEEEPPPTATRYGRKAGRYLMKRGKMVRR